MTSKKRTIAILLAIELVLSLLLTACGNGGDTPTGDNATPGAANTQNPEATPDEISDPSEMKPVTDISQYFSTDGKEFNIVKCAEDLGFDISMTQVMEELNSLQYDDKTDEKGTARRALFPFRYSRFHEDLVSEDGVNYQNITYEMQTFISYDSESMEFKFYSYGSEPYWIYSLPEDLAAKEKDVLITGRPVEDEETVEIYANPEIIDCWVWYMEYMNGFEDIQDFEYLMRAQYDYDLSKYLSGDEFDLVAYAGDLGFEIPYGLQYIEERQEYFCELLFEIDGRTYNAYFDSEYGDEPYAGVNIFEYPWKADENIGVAGMGFNTSAERNIRIIGAEGEVTEGLWLNGAAFYQLVWYLDKVAAANSLGELSEIDFDLW